MTPGTKVTLVHPSLGGWTGHVRSIGDVRGLGTGVSCTTAEAESLPGWNPEVVWKPEQLKEVAHA